MLVSRRFWLGVIITLVFLGLFLYKVDMKSLGEAITGANYLYIFPGVALYFLALWFRTVRWGLVLSPLGRWNARRLFPVISVGYMANNLLPLRLGELVRAYYLGRREGASKAATLATIVVERVLDGVVLMFLALVVLLFLPVLTVLRGLGESSGIPWLLLVLGIAGLFIGAFALLMGVAYFPAVFHRLVDRVLTLAPIGIRQRGSTLVGLFAQGLGALRSPRQLARIFLLSILIWMGEAAMYFVIAFSFGIDDSFSGLGRMALAILLVTAVSNLGISIPSSGGGVGPFEFFAKVVLVLLGVGSADASAYAIVLHVALLLPVTLLGLCYVWSDNLSLRRLAKESRASVTVISPSQSSMGQEEQK